MNRSATVLSALLVLSAATAQAQTKVYLNPSNQTTNPVSGGGNEAQYALDNANRAKTILTAAGFLVRVDQDFLNAPANANSWGANSFTSIHTNAGGGHGIETLYKSSGGKVLAGKVQAGLASTLPYEQRPTPLVYRDNLHVLNRTNMWACLTEALYHDCTLTSGRTGHPPSESAFLRTTDGRAKIAAGIAKGICSYYNKTCGTAPPPPADGTLKGVIYKNPDIANRIAGSVKIVGPSGTITKAYDGSATLWSATLKPGSYTITASATGYQSATITRTVTSGQLTYGSVGLNPATPTTGVLKGTVYAKPNVATKIAASVKVNTGATSAYTPGGAWTFTLAPGTYTVTATATGYKTGSMTKAVVAGQTATVDIGLDKIIPPDAGTIPPDAGTTIRPDASTPPDAGAEETPDTGFIEDLPDADEAELPPDAAEEPDPNDRPDAGAEPEAPPRAAPEADGSCGCSSTGLPLWPLAPLMLSGLAMRRTRRRD